MASPGGVMSFLIYKGFIEMTEMALCTWEE
jgi:hypothetical protein